MQPTISIVIPTYNSDATLEEAVNSVYEQKVELPFEIIIVNDGSTDGTDLVMRKLESKRSEIRLLSHSRNRGGGAARNTGIRASTAEWIFCLDSDNFLGQGALISLLGYAKKRKAVGAAVGRRRFFSGTDVRNYSEQVYDTGNKPVELADLFNASEIVLDNFLFTRSAWEKASGFPEHHGFDTQCFELRFLAAGQSVWFCPEAIFYHRQGGGKKSYFERVYEAGEYSRNIYLMVEECLFLFSPHVRKAIAHYDIFHNNRLGKNNLKSAIRTLYEGNPPRFFLDGYQEYLHEKGFEQFYNDFHNSSVVEDVYALATYDFLHGDLDKAEARFRKVKSSWWRSKIIDFNLARISVAKRGTSRVELEDRVLKTFPYFQLRKRKWEKRIREKILERFPRAKRTIKRLLGRHK